MVCVVPQLKTGVGSKGVDSICLILLFLAAVFCSLFVSRVLRRCANLSWSKKFVYGGRGLKKRKTRMVLAAASALASKTESWKCQAKEEISSWMGYKSRMLMTCVAILRSTKLVRGQQ